MDDGEDRMKGRKTSGKKILRCIEILGKGMRDISGWRKDRKDVEEGVNDKLQRTIERGENGKKDKKIRSPIHISCPHYTIYFADPLLRGFIIR